MATLPITYFQGPLDGYIDAIDLPDYPSFLYLPLRRPVAMRHKQLVQLIAIYRHLKGGRYVHNVTIIEPPEEQKALPQSG